MQPIKSLLNKIKWDGREKPEDYTISYEDRVLGKLVEHPYLSILRLEDQFFVILGEDGETYIPLHRIKKVKKEGKVVWGRKTELRE